MNNFTVPILNKRDEYRFVERILKERIDKAKFNPLNILITIDNVQEFDTSVFCDALLLRQKYNEKIYITIIFDISGLNETYAFIDKISNLLIFEIVCHWGVQPQWIKIINKNEEVQLKNVKSVTRMGTLVPYIPINEETSAIFKKQIDYKLFLETANKFADLNKNDDRKKFVFGDIFNEFALHKIQNSYSNVHIGVLTQTIQQLADCGKKYFDDVLNINIIEDFTCFQAYMFAFLLLQQKNKYNNANKEERLQIIQNVKNSINLYSEALYEIIENVEHHAKKGYVFFRVYRDFKNNPYLKREYHDYSLLHTNKDNNHLRFTNDDQEYYIGKEICEKISTKNQTNISTIEKKDQDVFVTCFSLNQDSRAMWSEYIRDEYGVSVGLDFRTGGKSCSGTKDNFEKHLAFKLLKPKDANDSKEKQQFSSSFYNRPYKVLYFIDEIKDYKNVNYEKEYINKKKLKNLINSSNHDRKTKDKIIPYIKHAAFVEEAECRLVFDYAPSVESFTDYYFYSENLFPVPFLLYTVAEHTETKSESYNMYVLYKRYKHITPGRTELDVEEKRIEIDVTLKELRENKNKSALLEKMKVKIFSEFELDNNQKNITHEIYIPAIFNSDMGKATDLYDKIQSLLEEIPYWPQNAKIWQLGRMPIRKIIVIKKVIKTQF